jgi:hypothetical protein
MAPSASSRPTSHPLSGGAITASQEGAPPDCDTGSDAAAMALVFALLHRPDFITRPLIEVQSSSEDRTVL